MLKARIEALLFAADQPLTVPAIRQALGDEIEVEAIRAGLEAIHAEYAARGGGFELVGIAGGWELRTRPDFAEDVRRLYSRRPKRLGGASLEVLAIVAYRQPCTRALIDSVRGVDSSGSLRTLLGRKLVAVAGRAKEPGRPHLYRTTPEFLRVFGLKSLKELPDPSEINELAEAHVLHLMDYRNEQTEITLPDTANRDIEHDEAG